MPDTNPPKLDRFVTADELAASVRLARAEDLGPAGVDVTSELFVPDGKRAEARIVARQPGRVCGGALLDTIGRAYDPQLQVQVVLPDASTVRSGDTVATISGPLRSILTAERIMLNYLTLLCGVATLTARYVERVQGTRARVYDTRKTIPGLRGLQKYAVACGGGATHRMGLYDAVLLKDNHLAHLGQESLTDAVADAVRRCRDEHPGLKFVMIEADTLEQLEQVLPTGVDLVLLDNMTCQQLSRAVSIRDRIAGNVELEASGGVSLDTVADVAATGVDRISVGALTHSAPALDLGLDVER